MRIEEIKRIVSEMRMQSAADKKVIEDAEDKLKIVFPSDYVDFLRFSNGAAGDIGDEYINFWSIEEVVEAHYDMQMESAMPGFVAFGGDGANEIYAFDMRTEAKAVVEVPLIVMNLEDLWFCSETFTGFLLMKARGERCKRVN